MYYSVSIIIIIIIITFLESLSLLFFRKTNGCVSLNPLKHNCFDKINDQNRGVFRTMSNIRWSVLRK